MTAKRDLKKLVRDRQARTGERYTTARKHVVAGRPGTGVPVVEVEDLTAEGARLGFKCRIAIFSELAERIDRVALLGQIRGALLATQGDPAMEPLRSFMLEGEPPAEERGSAAGRLQEALRFIARAQAGIGGVSPGGRMLALQTAGRRKSEMVLCLLWAPPVAMWAPREPSVILTSPRTLADLTLDLPLKMP